MSCSSARRAAARARRVPAGRALPEQFCGCAGMAPPAAEAHTHHWPGNVRELRNVIERAVISHPPAGAAVAPAGQLRPSSAWRRPAGPVPDSPMRRSPASRNSSSSPLLNHFSINKTAETSKSPATRRMQRRTSAPPAARRRHRHAGEMTRMARFSIIPRRKSCCRKFRNRSRIARRRAGQPAHADGLPCSWCCR